VNAIAQFLGRSQIEIGRLAGFDVLFDCDRTHGNEAIAAFWEWPMFSTFVASSPAGLSGLNFACCAQREEGSEVVTAYFQLDSNLQFLSLAIDSRH
jgi:hypothetical protein